MVKEEAEIVNWSELKATDALCKLANLPPIQPIVGKTTHAMYAVAHGAAQVSQPYRKAALVTRVASGILRSGSYT